jgi:hypothetical protein
MLLLRNPDRGGQGPNWAVEPYDDDDDDTQIGRANSVQSWGTSDLTLLPNSALVRKEQANPLKTKLV